VKEAFPLAQVTCPYYYWLKYLHKEAYRLEIRSKRHLSQLRPLIKKLQKAPFFPIQDQAKLFKKLHKRYRGLEYTKPAFLTFLTRV
jgi:hypothetical protein